MDRKRRLMENNNGWPLRSQLFDGAPFRLPLLSTAVPASAAPGTTATFTRATAKTWPNNDGYMVTGVAGEIGFVGARRVDNLIRLGAAQSSTLAVAASVTMTLPAGAYQFSMGAGTGTVTFSGTGGATGTLAASASGRTFVAKTISAGTLIVTASVATLIDIQVVSMVAETDQATLREYVSVGVASAPYYHGSFVDGVKCFPTDLSGNPIPSTTLLGYSAEGARTNLCLQSQTFETTWVPANTSVSSNTAVAPDGTTTADKLIPSAVASFKSITQTLSQSGMNVFSAYVKNAGYNFAFITPDNGTSGVKINLTTGEAVNAGSVTSAVSILANGWFRVECRSSITTTTLRIYAGSTTAPESFSGDTVSGIYIWGAQLELGSFASSYIATTTIAVARNADVLTYSSAGNIDGTKGWCYAEYSAAGSAPNSRIIGCGDGTSANTVLFASPTTGARASIYDGTSSTNTVETLSANVSIKGASSWGGSTKSVSAQGVVPVSGAFDGDVSLTGGVGVGIGGSVPWFGTIRNVRIGQRALSSSELQAITS